MYQRNSVKSNNIINVPRGKACSSLKRHYVKWNGFIIKNNNSDFCQYVPWKLAENKFT